MNGILAWFFGMVQVVCARTQRGKRAWCYVSLCGVAGCGNVF